MLWWFSLLEAFIFLIKTTCITLNNLECNWLSAGLIRGHIGPFTRHTCGTGQFTRHTVVNTHKRRLVPRDVMGQLHLNGFLLSCISITQLLFFSLFIHLTDGYILLKLLYL